MNSRLTSKRDDWQTPKWLVDIAHNVMGHIDLDPASSEIANKIVQAETYLSREDNGLNYRWHGNVFLNPPGGKTGNQSNSQIWWDKCIQEYSAKRIDALFYVGFSIEQLCINPSMMDATTICMLRKRIKFIGAGSSPTHSNFILLKTRKGEYTQRFYKELKGMGSIFRPYQEYE